MAERFERLFDHVRRENIASLKAMVFEQYGERLSDEDAEKLFEELVAFARRNVDEKRHAP